MLKEILEENSRRLAEIEASYDPVTGDAADPGRVKAFDDKGNLCYVPVEMTRDPLYPNAGSDFHWLRCRYDFPYWAATCAYIKNKGGGADRLFILNRAQRKLVAMLEEMRKADLPIRLILLKARQWGGSTCTQIYMSWLQLMHSPGLNSLIVAQQHSATSEIRNMFLRLMESYPEEMLARDSDHKKGSGRRTEGAGPGTIHVRSHNFNVKVGSAERPDSCRGGDYSLVHCSEVALWKKTRLRTPEDMLRAACSGVLLRPLTMILLESTANGTGNYFHSEYGAAKRGESQFRPLFIPWFEIEQYSLPFAEGERERFASELLAGKDCGHPTRERSQPGAYLWWLWEKGATLEAIHWYVKERRKYNEHAEMASEYPSDDVEAFAHSGARVFDRYCVEQLREACKRVRPRRGEIVGERPSGPSSTETVRFSEDSNGSLLLWKEREMNKSVVIENRYLVVVDIGGRSLSADWSVIAVFDRAPILEGGKTELVAQWRGHTDFDLLAWNAVRIARYFDDALLVIESNTLETHDMERMVDGDQSYFLLNQVRKVYRNLYARKQSPEDFRAGRPVKYGFHTNVSTKPMIISNLVTCIREGLYVERDELCLEEYLTYEQRQNGSYGALSGHHDDLLMTCAIGLHISMHEMRQPSVRRLEPWSPQPRLNPSRAVSAAFF